jgi:hypothetical protein
MAFEQVCQDGDAFGAGAIGEPHESSMRMFPGEHQEAEVVVHGDEDPVEIVRLLQERRVTGVAVAIVGIENVVPSRDQPLRQP